MGKSLNENTKKRKKNYEPIHDNGRMYIYNENPTEYMKARKYFLLKFL